MTDVAPLFSDWLASINVLIDLEEAKNQAEGAEAREIADGFLVVMVSLLRPGRRVRRRRRVADRPQHHRARWPTPSPCSPPSPTAT